MGRRSKHALVVWLLAACLPAALAQPSGSTSLTDIVNLREDQVRALAADAESAWSGRCAASVRSCNTCSLNACRALPSSANSTCVDAALLGTAGFCPAYSGRQASYSRAVSFTT